MAGGEIGAVLTGDVVGSTFLSRSERSRVEAAVAAAVEEIGAWEAGLVRGKVEFFRGDSWQLLLGRPEMALRAALRMRAGVVATGADTRVAIGIGDILPLDPDRIWRSSAEAFVLSGRRLDAMAKERLALAPSAEFGPLATWLALVVDLCGVFADEWTQRQAEVVARALDPRVRGQAAIARQFGMTVQNISKMLGRAHFGHIVAVLEAFEANDWLNGAQNPELAESGESTEIG